MTYSLNNAYITSTGSYLPGSPVSNDAMESLLGFVNGQASRYRKRILQSNGIVSRHYALDNDGQPNELTEELAVKAIYDALATNKMSKNELQLIATGTTLADFMAPGFASMVHGRLGGNEMDIVSCSGICGSGAAALKAAAHSVMVGQHENVVSVAAERPSGIMRGHFFNQEKSLNELEQTPNRGFEYFNADFLRWMLSDGAGAAIIQNQPSKLHDCLKIDWIETLSYANNLSTCMYMGTDRTDDYTVANSWLQDPPSSAKTASKLLLRQNVTLLSENMVRIVVDFATRLTKNRKLNVDQVQHFLPHISSLFFYQLLHDALSEADIGITEEKWFTNLTTKGNTGSASIFIMLDEAMKTNRFKPGEKILLMIPESGRFSVTYAQLTVYPAQ